MFKVNRSLMIDLCPQTPTFTAARCYVKITFTVSEKNTWVKITVKAKVQGF